MKTFRRMYIYKESHLPAEGWLHGCFLCYTITGNCEVFSKIEKRDITTEHVVYVCPSCRSVLRQSAPLRAEYDAKVKQYIRLSS